MEKIKTVEPGRKWTLDLFRPEDAPGVASLFRDVYGEGYPVKTYLEPDLLIQENAAGRVISVVARTDLGDIVGHTSLFNSAPCKNTFESGAGLVHRDYRGGRGIFMRLAARCIDIGKRTPGVDQVFGEPVCNHPISQKLCRFLGVVTRALEVSLMPAEAYEREASAQGRVSTLLEFITLKSKPCDVHVPEAYKELFPVFYADMDDERRFLPSDRPPPADADTRMSTQTFPFAQVARVAVETPGHDFAQVFANEEKRLLAEGIRVLQVWLSTGVAWVGAAVETLRQNGYFFGGVLPRWFDTDGLLMQKVLDDPDWESMVLHFDRAKELGRLVRADWERTRKQEAPV